jgi:hypothetical protein
MKRLEIKGIDFAYITLHAGLGNFRDIDGSLRNKGGVNGIYKNRLRGDEYEAMGLKYEGGYGPIDEPITGFLPGTGRTMNERHWKLTQVFFIEAGHKR